MPARMTNHGVEDRCLDLLEQHPVVRAARLLRQIEVRGHVTSLTEKHRVEFHALVQPFTTGGASLRPRSLVKRGTRESGFGPVDPGTSIAAAELAALMPRLTCEDLVAA